MEDDDGGVSRCGISGYFDEMGNPAALASGWLDMLDAKKRKTPLFFVMTPTHLAYFRRENHASITDDGFVTGDIDHETLGFWKSHGASVRLMHMETVSAEEGQKVIVICMKADCALPDGSTKLVLEAANKDIASGWSEALSGQIGQSGSIYAPVRMASSNDSEERSGGLLSALGSMLSLGGGGGSSAPVLADDEYFSYMPWEDQDVDLMDPRCDDFLIDADTGFPAAVMHGWLTKLNKSGVRAGAKDSGKDRYFVLTPEFVAFFPDAGSARVDKGYMRGTADTDRITGFLSKSGGKIGLETIGEIRPGRDGLNALQRAMAEDLETAPRKPAASKAPATKPAPPAKKPKKRAAKKSSDDDEEEDEESDSNDEDEAADGTDAQVEADGSARGDDAGGENVDENAEEGKGASPKKPRNRETWFEIDCNEFVLAVNAHNLKNRNAWIRRLRAWTAWRKQRVDRDMLKRMSMGKN